MTSGRPIPLSTDQVWLREKVKLLWQSSIRHLRKGNTPPILRRPMIDHICRNRPILDSFTKEIPTLSKFGSIIVETRNLEYLDFVIKNHLFFVDADFGLTVFHGKRNERQLKKMLERFNVRYVNLHRDILDRRSYNKLLTSTFFYDLIPYEKFLLFQHDTLLCRRGVTEFLAYDYVGAPWSTEFPWNNADLSGGNGGLSLRDKHRCLQVIAECPYGGEHEDVYFTHGMKSIGARIAPREVCMRFGVESVFYESPFGIHNPHPMLSDDEIARILGHVKYH